MENNKHIIFILISFFSFANCSNSKTIFPVDKGAQERAISTLDSLYEHYSISGTELLRETYPFDADHKTTYQASEEQANQTNKYSYLWPYSGTFSAVNALIEATENVTLLEILENKVLVGLEEYFDITREPYAYSSYVREAPLSDRFYDDNIWLGIDFTDTYSLTKDKKYLDKANLIWQFILSGTDDKLGGGIYWVEQRKESKHSCSNAPGAVFAFKLFEATSDSIYFYKGKEFYEWTKQHLQDNKDHLIFDNINISGKVDKSKYPYNSGQMIQAAAQLYKLTKNESYLTDAQNIAKSAYNYFFEDYRTEEGNQFRILKKSDIWFISVMMRGFIELYQQDGNAIYLEEFRKNLDYAWNHMRDDNGLFNTDWKGIKKDEKKWLLTQAGMVEMYARISDIKSDNK